MLPRRGTLVLMGPAFVAAVAYVDPGNFATNFAAGSYGYTLLWVLVTANLIAMLVQSLAAKLGLATGRSVAELCRERFPRPVTVGLWLQAELVAIATDLAEVVGGALALYLLFGVPLPVGGLLTAVVSFAILGTQRRGYRPFEYVVAGMLGIIAVGFLYTGFFSGFGGSAAAGGLVPSFAGTESVLLATGIVGATVMPHVIYVHSAWAARRYDDVLRAPSLASRDTTLTRILQGQRTDIVVALGLAGLVNAAMVLIAAQVVPVGGEVSGALEEVHSLLGTAVGNGAPLAFALALLASGLAASAVGTYAGQVVMEGFLRRRIPLLLRRVLTIAPALVVLVAGVDPTTALMWSQVVLSFGIPFALVPVLLFTARRDLMGRLVNRRITTVAAGASAALIIGINCFLLVDLAV